MRIINIITAAASLAVAWTAHAQPAYTLEQGDGVGVLSITGAEIVQVGGHGATLVDGIAIPAVSNGVAYAVGGEQSWRLAPGVYAVTAYAPAVGAAPRVPTEWSIAVEPPAPPVEPDRIHQIADALGRWIAVANDWAVLAPTTEEVRDALLLTFREPRTAE